MSKLTPFSRALARWSCSLLCPAFDGEREGEVVGSATSGDVCVKIDGLGIHWFPPTHVRPVGVEHVAEAPCLLVVKRPEPGVDERLEFPDGSTAEVKTPTVDGTTIHYGWNLRGTPESLAAEWIRHQQAGHERARDMLTERMAKGPCQPADPGHPSKTDSPDNAGRLRSECDRLQRRLVKARASKRAAQERERVSSHVWHEALAAMEAHGIDVAAVVARGQIKAGVPSPLARTLGLQQDKPAEQAAKMAAEAWPDREAARLDVESQRGKSREGRERAKATLAASEPPDPVLPPGCRLVPNGSCWNVKGRPGRRTHNVDNVGFGTSQEEAAADAWDTFGAFMSREDWQHQQAQVAEAQREREAADHMGKMLAEQTRRVRDLKGEVKRLTAERDEIRGDLKAARDTLGRASQARAEARDAADVAERSEASARERMADLGDQFNAERAKRQALEQAARSALEAAAIRVPSDPMAMVRELGLRVLALDTLRAQRDRLLAERDEARQDARRAEAAHDERYAKCARFDALIGRAQEALDVAKAPRTPEICGLVERIQALASRRDQAQQWGNKQAREVDRLTARCAEFQDRWERVVQDAHRALDGVPGAGSVALGITGRIEAIKVWQATEPLDFTAPIVERLDMVNGVALLRNAAGQRAKVGVYQGELGGLCSPMTPGRGDPDHD